MYKYIYIMTTCICLTSKGKQCKNHIKKDSKFCWLHQNCKKTITEIKMPIPAPIPLPILAPVEIKKPKRSIVGLNSAGIPVFKRAEKYTQNGTSKLNTHEDYKQLDAKTLIKQNPKELDKVYMILYNRGDLNENTLDDLISAGWDINKTSKEYYGDGLNTPLCHAAEYRNDEVTELLLDKGADPNIVSGQTLAVESVVAGHSADDKGEEGEKVGGILDLLFQNGAKLVMRKWFYKEFLLEPYNRDATMRFFIETFKVYDIDDWPTYK
jgi:hypothetical protein